MAFLRKFVPSSTPSTSETPPDPVEEVNYKGVSRVFVCPSPSVTPRPSHPLPVRYDTFVRPDEEYITHARVRKPGREKERVLVITRSHAYKYNPENNQLQWRKDLREIVRVEAPETASLLRVVMRGAMMVKARMVESDAVPIGDGLVMRAFYMDDWEEAWKIATAMKRLVVERWQAHFEGDLLGSDEMYQYHTSTHKVNRKGKEQLRFILLSDRNVYNCDAKSGWEPGAVKWDVPLASIVKACVYVADNRRLTLAFDLAKIPQKKKEMKDEVTYTFDGGDQKDGFLLHLRCCYRRFNAKKLEIEKRRSF